MQQTVVVDFKLHQIFIFTVLYCPHLAQQEWKWLLCKITSAALNALALSSLQHFWWWLWKFKAGHKLGRAPERGGEVHVFKVADSVSVLSVWPWRALSIVSSLYPQAGTDEDIQGKKSAWLWSSSAHRQLPYLLCHSHEHACLEPILSWQMIIVHN